jgi:hypothetical protein
VGQQNIIELNGKQYDAVTGVMLGDAPGGQSNRRANAAVHRGGRTIDGFVRTPKGVSPTPTIVKPSAPKAAATAAKTKSQGRHLDLTRAPRPIKPHKQERPKTLMRHVVSKPKTTMKPAIKTAAPSEIMAKPVSSIAKQLEKKMSVTQVNPRRLARARHVERSHHIHRFNQPKRQKAGVSVAQPQSSTRATVTAPQSRPAAQAFRPAVQTMSNSAALTNAKQKVASQQHKVDIFEAALAHAVSHEQMPQPHAKRSRRHRRLVNAVAGVGAFLVLGGFLAYLNMPAIELQVASMRAGFHAELPDYSPMGYALDGGVKNNNGQISMKFTSGSSSYLITQEASDWNSATLLDQEAVRHGEPTQTIQSKGRIIYIYDEDSATWVNGGVRYQIHGNNALDADELVAVATSL